MRPIRHADSAAITAKQDYFNEFSQLLKSRLLVLSVLDVLGVLAVLGRARGTGLRLRPIITGGPDSRPSYQHPARDSDAPGRRARCRYCSARACMLLTLNARRNPRSFSPGLLFHEPSLARYRLRLASRLNADFDGPPRSVGTTAQGMACRLSPELALPRYHTADRVRTREQISSGQMMSQSGLEPAARHYE